jgi:hypothetical protein
MVGGFHLPSAVCPPSEISETLSDRVWHEPRALDGPGAHIFTAHIHIDRSEIGRAQTTAERLRYGESALSWAI